MTKKQRRLMEIVVFILSMILSFNLSPFKKTLEQISYLDFMSKIEETDIDQVLYCEDESYAEVHCISDGSTYKVTVVSNERFIDDIYDYSMKQINFKFNTISPPKERGIFSRFVIIILFNLGLRVLMICFFRYYNEKKEIRSSDKNGKKDDKKFNTFPMRLKQSISGFQPKFAKNIDIKFADVIGLEKQIQELQDIVNFLKNPQKYEEIGAQLPKGVLLYGRPGVGKTYIARAIAGEASVPFYITSASELQSKYLGESEERIRAIFKEAENNSPSIIYIDEIDSIATKRYSDYSNRYSASILNQLLACMDGFNKESKVIVIAATNHIDTLDSAILRSGRFDRKIYIHEPDKEARKKLIEYYSQDKVIDSVVDIERIVDITTGLTGADIKTILNEAAIIAVRNGETCISEDVIMEAFRKVEIGSENNYTPLSKEKLTRTAIHEAGHAVVSYYFGQAVAEISIIARGNAAGYNLSAPNEDNDYVFDELKHEVMCLLGGRAAEEVVYNDVSAGASDDLRRASSIIENMFVRLSMNDESEISLVLTDDEGFNDLITRNLFGKIEAFMKKCYAETMEIIKKKRKILNRLAESLLAKEILSKLEIEEILKEDN